MMFSVIFSTAIIFCSLIIDELISEFSISMEDTYGINFLKDQSVFANSTEEQMRSFCPTTDNLLLLGQVTNFFFRFIMISGLGYFTVIIQQLTILKLKDNVELSLSHLFLQISIVLVSAVCFMIQFNNEQNHLMTDVCSQVADFSGEDKQTIGFVFSLLAQTNTFSFSMVVSLIVCQYSLIMIVMLQRTQKLGELIMMVSQMINEVKKFFITFGLPLGVFIIIDRMLNT